MLPDDKNSAKDLKFCPTQDFETLDEAKHCAALLALHYVEPLRPLERKLPDPYRELWLAMTTAPAAAAPASAGKAGASGKKAQATGAAAKKASKTDASVVTVAPAAASATAAASDDSGMDLWGSSPDPEPSASDAKPKKKTPPIVLTADRSFASHAELEQAKLARVQERNKKQRARENRERANVPKQVFMSAACREMIESVLRSLGTITASDDSARNEKEDDDARESDAQVASQLQAIGFDDAHVRSALQTCVRSASDSDSDFMTRVLDWLCLHVPEGELPRGFNPEGTQLDVVRTTTDDANAVAMSPVLVQRLMKYGYDRRDAVAVVNAYLKTHPEDAGVERPTPEILYALLQALFPHQLAHFGVDTSASVAPSDADEIAAQRQDEVFALEAIYDDRFQSQTLSDAAQTQLVVLQVSDDVQLELFFPSASQYPYELPVLGLTTSNTALQPFLLFTAGSVLKSVASALGEPMIYDMCVAVDTILAECAHKASGPKIVIMPQEAPDSAKPARKGPVKTTPPPASAAADKNKSKSKRPANKKRSNTPRRVDPEAVKHLSDSLTQARERKANVPAYQQMQRARAKLPAAAETRNVIALLERHQVLLVCGQTGCGKTTQVPQFILDDYIQRNRGGECNIVCTQPRRIAAIGVATRVAQERCEDIADVVGYQIRMEAKKSAATRLLFCTTGVLLRRLLSDRLLTGVRPAGRQCS